MISVGIDVSKGRSTICILKPYGEVVLAPYEMEHTERDLQQLIEQIRSFSDGELRVVLEATGIYHLPVVAFYSNKASLFRLLVPSA